MTNQVVVLIPVEQAVDRLMNHMYVKYEKGWYPREKVAKLLTTKPRIVNGECVWFDQSFNGYIDEQFVLGQETYYNDKAKEIWQL